MFIKCDSFIKFVNIDLQKESTKFKSGNLLIRGKVFGKLELISFPDLSSCISHQKECVYFTSSKTKGRLSLQRKKKFGKLRNAQRLDKRNKQKLKLFEFPFTFTLMKV